MTIFFAFFFIALRAVTPIAAAAKTPAAICVGVGPVAAGGGGAFDLAAIC